MYPSLQAENGCIKTHLGMTFHFTDWVRGMRRAWHRVSDISKATREEFFNELRTSVVKKFGITEAVPNAASACDKLEFIRIFQNLSEFRHRIEEWHCTKTIFTKNRIAE